MVGVLDARGLSPLQQTAATATDIWNDSCAVDELTYAIEHGAVGATANPTIVHDVWKKDPKRWAGRVRELMPIVDTESLRRRRAQFVERFTDRPYYFVRAANPQVLMDEVEKVL